MSQSLRVSRIHFAVFVDSLLWKALAFARGLHERSPWASRQLRRAVLLLWWSVTLQLHIHARYWLRARRSRRATPAVDRAAVLKSVDPLSVMLPHADDPVVSIIVPTYGQVPFTLRCLASVAQWTRETPIEVIVVDDAWRGADVASLDLVRGIRVVRNETNLGFLHSCNKAAAVARGRYICFLNNDTQVLEGWLEPMVALFRHRNDTGAVGAKLLFPDGRLQESGGIIWDDASGWNFGRLEDPAKPQYNYVREVDYCSGAALMVERAVFSRLGGFDGRYAPAYFEDSDLCFRLRRIGLKTLYQPDARVVHYEGVSHGRDTAAGIKSCQVRNRQTFLEAWGDVLVREHYPNGQNVFRARERSMNRTVVLVIDHYIPTPDRDAGSRTVAAYLECLVQAGCVVKFWPHNGGYSAGYTEALQAMGIEVFHGPGQPSFGTWIKAVGPELDVVLVSRPEVAEDVIAAIRHHSKARLVFYGHDLHFRRMQGCAGTTGDERLRRLADHMRSRECAIWRQVDLSVYPSEEEAAMARDLQPGANIGMIVPYCFDRFASARAAPAGHEIIFVAGFGHPPNEDAAIWFVSKIFPLIRAEVPDAALSIIGSDPTARVRALAADGIAVFGDVSESNLVAAYGRARVAVVPLRYGAGVKLKAVEALRAGVPVVTTPVGAQGLPGLSALADVREDVASFACAVVAALRDDAEWTKRSRDGVEYARARFSRAAMTASLLRALAITV